MKRVLPALALLSAAVFIAVKLFPVINMKELTVITVPGGVSLDFNGVPAGFAPATRYVPSDGVHIKASRSGFFSEDTLLEEVPDTLFIQLLQGALIVVNTVPSGLPVTACDTFMTSPCSLVAMPGHPVEITAKGENGISLSRMVNVVSPEVKVVTMVMPSSFTDPAGDIQMALIPGEATRISAGTLTAGRDEVTAAQFCRFMNAVDPDLRRDSTTLRGRTLLLDSIMRCNWNGPVGFDPDTLFYAPYSGMENHPVTGVTYEGALWYCRWLTEESATGMLYRLPDRSEWMLLAEVAEQMPANLSDVNESILTRHPELNDGWSRTAPAGAMGYSSLGLGNMTGNVWEWTSEPGVAVGGSWLSSLSDCTAQGVIHLDPGLGYPFTGFRVFAEGGSGSGTLF
ncbi:hypothetical protein CSA37_01640 [Candidatus Fermentibacteria bacterium]|nr:MAG: hypothetical protein CSA37_01640 [Candidatus Fermentibacteria bacterium]